MAPKEIERRVNPENPGEFTERVRETTDSIEVTRSAKGKYHWSIKAYSYPDELEGTVDKIDQIDKLLRQKFRGELEETP